MKKQLLLLTNACMFCFVSMSIVVQAQNPDLKRTNHWFFGEQAGLDFSSGTAVADTNGKTNTLEGTAAISDTAGNLLFYYGRHLGTRYKILNRNHQVMVNGDNMLPNGAASPRQAGIIIPRPGSDSIYYLFTVDGWENQWQHGIRYSEIDMSLDSGLGAVTSNKNVLLVAPVTEQLAAVKHANGCDYWVTTHERYSDKFLSYLVTDMGVDTTPVISAIGADYGYMSTLNPYAGGYETNFSPNGSFVAVFDFWAWPNGTGIFDTVMLLKFNRSTGAFYDNIGLGVDSVIACLAISPDNSKLYVETGWYRGNLYQYDVSVWRYSAILSSRVIVQSTGISANVTEDFQNGNDGKIYGSNETNFHLHVMHNPDASGTACNYVTNDLYLEGRKLRAELPSFVQSYFEEKPVICGAAGVSGAQNLAVRVFPNPASENLGIIAADLREVKIFDLNGKAVFHKSFKTYSSIVQIDVDGYARGLYILEIKTKTNHFNHKIILQ